jgi:hypothetical protein
MFLGNEESDPPADLDLLFPDPDVPVNNALPISPKSLPLAKMMNLLLPNGHIIGHLFPLEPLGQSPSSIALQGNVRLDVVDLVLEYLQFTL